MNVLSLFSGIGGLELGLERAGMTVVGQVEKAPFCRRVLEAHWPGVARHDDVCTAIEWWGREPRPVVHVVAGGPPCQAVSEAGEKLYQEDARWLWPEMFAVVDHVRPEWVIVENVVGLLKRGLEEVLGDLSSIGYDAEWDCVPAATLGAPHQRDRVFAVAYPARVGRGTGRAGGPHDEGTDRGGLAPEGLEGRGRIFSVAPRYDQWPAEPAVGRMAHGVPSQVDRLRSLGNSVVPSVGEHIGRLVMAAAAEAVS